MHDPGHHLGVGAGELILQGWLALPAHAVQIIVQGGRRAQALRQARHTAGGEQLTEVGPAVAIDLAEIERHFHIQRLAHRHVVPRAAAQLRQVERHQALIVELLLVDQHFGQQAGDGARCGQQHMPRARRVPIPIALQAQRTVLPQEQRINVQQIQRRVETKRAAVPGGQQKRVQIQPNWAKRRSRAIAPINRGHPSDLLEVPEAPALKRRLHPVR